MKRSWIFVLLPFVVQFVFLAISAQGQLFAPPVNYGVGNNPVGVIASDLDGDGDNDLVTANWASNNISVLRNNGTGVFQTAVPYAAGTVPLTVFAADLDGDGDKDLAVANQNSNNVSILLNDGTGVFHLGSSPGTGQYPDAVIAADLDGDGDNDLATTNWGANDNVSILINNGNGTFQTAVNYAVGTDPGSLAAADLDGDGDVDLAVSNITSNNVYILINNGSGIFTATHIYTVGNGPYWICAADFDGDGDQDLATANNGSANVSVLLNNSNGSFQTSVPYAAGSNPYSISAADFNGDDNIDLAVANYGGNVSILINIGSGIFQAPDNYGAGTNPASVFASDLDGDGIMDLAVANEHSNNVSILMNLSPPGRPSFKIFDGAPEPQPIANHLCKIYKIAENNIEVFLGERTTGSDGLVELDSGWFNIGDHLKIEMLAHRYASSRPGRDAINNLAYNMIIDNATIQNSGPILFEDTYMGISNQPIILKHTIIKFGLVVGIEWDAPSFVLDNIEGALRDLANYLYDVTDGQATIDSVAVYDNCWSSDRQSVMNGADIKIMAKNYLKGGAQALWGYFGLGSQCLRGQVTMPRVLYSDRIDDNIEISNQNGIDWRVEQVYFNNTTYYYPGIQAIAHELGHYLLYFGEEYSLGDPNLGCPGPLASYSFGLMDTPLLNTPSTDVFGEMSSQYSYDQAGSINTHQWCVDHMSCWDFFEAIYQGGQIDYAPFCITQTSTPYRNIIKPTERPGLNGPFTGPNNDLNNPDINVGALTNVQIIDENAGSGDVRWTILQDGDPLRGAIIWLQKSDGSIIDEGKTASNGQILVLGANAGDIARAYKTIFRVRWDTIQIAEQIVSPSILEDSIVTEMTNITPNQPMAIRFKCSGPGSLQIVSDYTKHFNELPEMSLVGSEGQRHSETLSILDSSYISTDGIVSGSRGEIFINAFDDSMQSFFIPISYQWTIADSGGYIDEANSANQECTMTIDTSMSHLDAALIANYNYILPSTGLPENAFYASSVFNLSFFPETAPLFGINSLSIKYYLPDTLHYSNVNIQMFRWDYEQRSWANVPAIGDTAAGAFYALTNNPGIYILTGVILNSGCQYMPGDINNNGTANGVDIVYAVNYFKGGPNHPPVDCYPGCPNEPNPFFAAGDVNGNCAFNGVDITFFVRYLKGQVPSLLYCTDCPPASSLALPAPAVELIKTPTLKAPIQSKDSGTK
jgi:hypothetical protein